MKLYSWIASVQNSRLLVGITQTLFVVNHLECCFNFSCWGVWSYRCVKKGIFSVTSVICFFKVLQCAFLNHFWSCPGIFNASFLLDLAVVLGMKGETVPPGIHSVCQNLELLGLLVVIAVDQLLSFQPLGWRSVGAIHAWSAAASVVINQILQVWISKMIW